MIQHVKLRSLNHKSLWDIKLVFFFLCLQKWVCTSIYCLLDILTRKTTPYVKVYIFCIVSTSKIFSNTTLIYINFISLHLFRIWIHRLIFRLISILKRSAISLMSMYEFKIQRNFLGIYVSCWVMHYFWWIHFINVEYCVKFALITKVEKLCTLLSYILSLVFCWILEY